MNTLKNAIKKNSKKKKKSASRGKTKSKSEITKKKIIAAARKVFIQNSYKSASLRMIAKEGGFTFSLINHYFSKSQLFEAVAKELLDEFLSALAGWMKDMDKYSPEKGLDIFIERALDDLFKKPDAVQILLQNIPQAGGQIDVPGLDFFTKYISEARGTFIKNFPLDIEPEKLIMWLYGFIHIIVSLSGAAFYHGQVLGMDPKGKEYKEWIKSMLLYLFAPPLKEMLQPIFDAKQSAETT